MESYKRREEMKAKQRMAMNYNEASLIANFVGLRLSGKKLPSLYETFPALATKEIMEQQEEQKEYAESMRYKIQFMEMATAHNQARKRKGGALT